MPDTTARDALIEQHITWARDIARHVAGMLPPSWDVDDLIGLAEEALLQQAARYDPARGVPFRAFAVRRVTGACLAAARGGKYREAAHEPLDAVNEFFAAAGPSEEAEDVRRAAYRVWRSLWRIPARHHQLIVQHYQFGATFAELSARWRLSEGRIAQLHQEALEMLRVMVR